MAWAILLLAGLFEVVWAVTMKLSDGFTKPLYSGITIVAMLISVGLLGLAMKSLPLSTAYAVWTGIGTVGSVAIGMLWMGESRDAARLLCVFLIIAGIVGLKLLGKE